jgi:two-component system sensor histidine kinase UhpB
LLSVLIVEDCDTDYLLVERRLKKWLSGVRVRCERAAARPELIAMLAQRWDLVITDYHLPDIEGAELLDAISIVQSNTPCIVMSGSAPELRAIAATKNLEAVEKGDSQGLHAALTSLGFCAE